MKLLPNWRRVLPRAWSVRLVVLGASGARDQIPFVER